MGERLSRPGDGGCAGHTPTPEVEWIINTLCLDTGCVFGGKLTALRYPEKEIVDVSAERVWYAPVKPFLPEPTAAPVARPRDELTIDDVLGKRFVQTSYHGRIAVREENAAGALEVMSRFALDPRWLLYLPPTMAPTATSRRPDLLEHPDEAFAGYRADGVAQLMCQEKHMGSRAVVLLCRDDEVAASPFGSGGGTGAVYTRTGRTFFPPALTETLLGRLREAVTKCGVWDELSADWLLLDAELMPWSAKAEDLLRNQYAAVGAAADSALGAAVSVLEKASAAGRGTRSVRCSNARVPGRAMPIAYREAYRRYCWPTDGLDGLRLAPFQLLASGVRSGAVTYYERDHGWHLALIDRLVEAAPDLLQSTRRLLVDSTDPESTSAAVRWWDELTAGGGEGMVVKPLANLARGTPQSGPAGHQGARPRVSADHLRARLHRAGEPVEAAGARTRAQALARGA